jgi:hypothetical protein
VGKNHLEDLDVDGQTLLKLTFMKEWIDMDWVDIGHDKDKWRTFVNAALKPSDSIKCGGISCLAEGLLVNNIGCASWS